MLKRNGELCEHPVPGWPGLLTDSEQKAYQAALAAIERELREFNEGATALAQIEKQIPTLAKLASTSTPRNTLAIQSAGGEWQIHQTLRKSTRNELLLCSRSTERGVQFGIVERFTHDGLYTQAHGNADLLMTSNRPALLLQDFAERERRVLELFRNDIEALAEETLAEKFPGQDHSRVVRAISARCEKQISQESRQHAPAEKQTRNVRIRF